jgi:putative peptidoglycan binding protein
MKTHKLLFLALIGSAVFSVSARADDYHRKNGSHAAPAPARSAPSTVRYGSGSRFNGGGMIAPSQRFSSIGVRSMPSVYRPHYMDPRRVAPVGQRQFTAGTLSRHNGVARFENSRARNLGIIQQNRGNRVGSIGNGNRGLAGGSNHVFARRSPDWHRDWDRNRDHSWHGHRCRFVNGSWFIFDLGFFPGYGYPYDYYGYDYYPNDYSYPYSYGYDSGVYEGADPNYYDQGNYDSSDQNADSTVAAAQERLARQGYYRGEIDGVFGPATRRAIMRYQRDNGLRVTGYLTMDTRQSLGLRQGARY